ncbi:MAG: hypothetical protein E2O68_04085 [Deltaproteobacteria bacterium]|nr:MAG: hypothetical protein E2O68_04085 [Deltaproteobacteria bacterium]
MPIFLLGKYLQAEILHSNCPSYTFRAKNKLEEANINFIYHNVENDPSARDEIFEKVKEIVSPHTPLLSPKFGQTGVILEVQINYQKFFILNLSNMKKNYSFFCLNVTI